MFGPLPMQNRCSQARVKFLDDASGGYNAALRLKGLSRCPLPTSDKSCRTAGREEPKANRGFIESFSVGTTTTSTPAITAIKSKAHPEEPERLRLHVISCSWICILTAHTIQQRWAGERGNCVVLDASCPLEAKHTPPMKILGG